MDSSNVRSPAQIPEDSVDAFVPSTDAALLRLGTSVGESASPFTSDGLYLLAGIDTNSAGEVVALEMDLAQGGSLEIQVYTLFQNGGQ